MEFIKTIIRWVVVRIVLPTVFMLIARLVLNQFELTSPEEPTDWVFATIFFVCISIGWNIPILWRNYKEPYTTVIMDIEDVVKNKINYYNPEHYNTPLKLLIARLFMLLMLTITTISCGSLQNTNNDSIEQKEDSLVSLKSSVEDQNGNLRLTYIAQLESKMIFYLNESQCPPEHIMRDYEQNVAQYNEYAKDHRKREYEIKKPYKGLLTACREVQKK